MTGPHVLVARLDDLGDVLLTGPAVRAVAADASRVTFLAGPSGAAAAALLPGVDEVLTFEAPWVPVEAPPVDGRAVDELVAELRRRRIDRGIVFTSFHQSPLPLALLLRLAGIPEVGASSVDYPGSLLDVRHRPGGPSDDDEHLHEVARSLSLVETFGHTLPQGDDGALAIRDVPPAPALFGDEPYVVVHPGASAPARAWPTERAGALVDVLVARGWSVAVTGSRSEADLTEEVAGQPHPSVQDLGGETDLLALAGVLRGAAAVVCGNTGPAHLAAAVGTPVVSMFAPVVPAGRWRPWGVPVALLGDQDIPCRGCRARRCPFEDQPCIRSVTPLVVANALDRLLAATTDDRRLLTRPALEAVR